jgi:protein-S-isoprenylcysteine O-methyltransferase Ste14
LKDLLGALGWSTTVGVRCRLLLTIAVATAAFALAGELAALVVPATAVQLVSWCAWLLWLGVIFPRNRNRDMETGSPLPYRRAFRRDILAGIACSFAQLLRPVVHSLATGEHVDPRPVLLVAGATAIVGGVALIYHGVRALGVARTLFVHEYVILSDITTAGIYRHIRHPLFLGGVMASAGAAIALGTPTALALATINVCVIPVYVMLEDRRCTRILGERYASYRLTVGAVLPRSRARITLSAHESKPVGMIEPSTGRAAASDR